MDVNPFGYKSLLRLVKDNILDNCKTRNTMIPAGDSGCRRP